MTILSTRHRIAMRSRAALLALSMLPLALPNEARATATATQVQTNDNAKSERQNRAVVEAAFEKWRAGTYVFQELLAPNVVWTIHGSGAVAGTYRNQKDFIERASLPLTSRLSTPILPQVHGIFADGDTIVIRFHGTATTTSGAPYRNQFVWIFKMKDGLVVNAEAFLDLAAYQQVVDNNAPRAQ